MNQFYKLLVAAVSAAFFIASAQAQNAGTVTNHAFAVGKGAGTTGYTSLLCTSAQLAVGQAAADPICRTITGDVTITAAGVTAIGANKVTNSQLNTMAANTTKCNATAGTANPTDCTASTMKTNLSLVIGTNVEAWDADLDCVAALSSTGVISRTGAGTCSAGALALSGLATGTQDTVVGYFGSTTASGMAIPNCTGALTYSTATHTIGCNSTTAGNVSNTGTPTANQLPIWTNATTIQGVTPALLFAAPANPTGTASAVGVMAGTGGTCKLTPSFSSRVRVLFIGLIFNTTASTAAGVSVNYGTGAAPANGAALTGTSIDLEKVVGTSSSGQATPFTAGGIVTGLTPGTAYWFDLRERAVSGGTATIISINCIIEEIP